MAALREDAPISELASQFGIHATVIHRWKREALQAMEENFKRGSESKKNNQSQDIKLLHEKIGELTVERDFLERASIRLGIGGVKK